MPTSRRQFILTSSAFVLVACADDAAPAVTEEPEVATATAAPAETSTSPGESPGALTAAMFEALGTCTLLPRSTEGPYPNRSRLDRRDIHEDYPGHPLRLGLRVVDRDCEPVPGAVVEIWHADATGDYSEYEDGGSGKDEGEESTFCRGAQTADADGIVEFETIYPGWYEGRAVHIHVTVELDGEHLRTGQLYFDEDYTEGVYESGEYARFGPPDTPWSEDPIIDDPETDGSGITLAASPTGRGPGTLGLVNLGVDPG